MRLFRNSWFDVFVAFAPLAIAIAAGVLVMLSVGQALSHDSWISQGGYLNKHTREWCCGEGDCFMLRDEQVRETRAGYEITFGITAGVSGPIQQETVPYPEAQPSPDGKFWRCKRPDGSRRCFFAPPPST
jgi:hypothetical protein